MSKILLEKTKPTETDEPKKLNFLKKGLNWFDHLRIVTVRPEQALHEYYRYKFVVLAALAAGFGAVWLWSKRVILDGTWKNVWFAFLIITFSIVLIASLWQLKQAYRCRKLFPKERLLILPANPTLKVSGKPQLPLWVCLLIIFGLSFLFIRWLNSGQVQWLLWDSTDYHGSAWNMLGPAGFQASPLRPSGYHVVVSYFMETFGANYFASLYLFQSSLLALNSVIVFALAWLITSKRRVAWLSGLLGAFCPFTAAYADAVLTEACAFFLLTASVYLGVLVLKRPNILAYYALLGLSSSLLLEIRYNFQAYIAIPVLLIIFFSRSKILAKVGQLALLTLMVAIVLIPAVAANYKVYNEIVLFTKIQNVPINIINATYTKRGHWSVEHIDLDIVKPLIQKYPYAFDYINCEATNCPHLNESISQMNTYLNEYFDKYKWRYVSKVLSNLWEVWDQPYLFPYSAPLPTILEYGIYTRLLNWFYLWFALVGFYFLIKYKHASIPIIGGVVYLWLTQAIFWVEPRYVRPIYPTLLFVTALGLVSIFERFSLWRQKQFLKKPLPKNAYRGWLAIPLVCLLIIATPATIIKTATYDYAFALQLESIPLIFWQPYTPYYQAAMPILLKDLKSMRDLVVYENPATKADIPYLLGNEEGERNRIDPNRLTPLVRLDIYIARTYFRLGQYDEAIIEASRAISLNPKAYEAYHWRSKAYGALGDLEKAGQDQSTLDRILPPELQYIRKPPF